MGFFPIEPMTVSIFFIYLWDNTGYSNNLGGGEVLTMPTFREFFTLKHNLWQIFSQDSLSRSLTRTWSIAHTGIYDLASVCMGLIFR